MSPELRLLAAVAALVISSANAAARSFFVPLIQVCDSTTPVVEPEAPMVFIAIPKYSLTEDERETIAACLILEAASQGEFGMRAVMSVIRNRARTHPELFVPTVLRPKQFSALNVLTGGRESLAQVIGRAKRDRMWRTALAIVNDATLDSWHDSTVGATHYTLSRERTHWTSSLAKTVTIGAHSFYR